MTMAPSFSNSGIRSFWRKVVLPWRRRPEMNKPERNPSSSTPGRRSLRAIALAISGRRKISGLVVMDLVRIIQWK